MASVKPIGQPESDAERKAICYLKDHLPCHYIIFHNLELTKDTGLPYEYDLIVVGEYAVYTLEVKGTGGLIKGNASEWELESGEIRKSPIPLANKKQKVVATRLADYSPLLENVFVWSLIVLTDDKARVRLNDDQADRVMHLDEAVNYILDPDRLPIDPKPITRLTNLIHDAISNQFSSLHRPHEIGVYRVLETFGKNNLYTTLLAEHQLIRPQSRFTLKVYNSNIYASEKTRKKQGEWILRDANALHRLASHPNLAGHPNIIRAHPPFPWQHNQIVLPLEWVDGYSLRGLLDSRTELDLARKADIIKQIGEGLRYAHSNGVIHRDVRPDNIIIPHQGPIKLVNFDCARIEGDDDLQTISSRLGRHFDQRYVAPEVWLRPRDASRASDQYALGIILFELLTGQPPYNRIQETFAAKGLPRRPTELNPNLPFDVDKVIGRMCAFKPAERYETLAEALDDIAIIL